MATPHGMDLVTGRRLVALQSAADELSLSVKTIRRRIADGSVTGYRVGRVIRVDMDELYRLLVVRIPSAR